MGLSSSGNSECILFAHQQGLRNRLRAGVSFHNKKRHAGCVSVSAKQLLEWFLDPKGAMVELKNHRRAGEVIFLPGEFRGHFPRQKCDELPFHQNLRRMRYGTPS